MPGVAAAVGTAGVGGREEAAGRVVTGSRDGDVWDVAIARDGAAASVAGVAVVPALAVPVGAEVVPCENVHEAVAVTVAINTSAARSVFAEAAVVAGSQCVATHAVVAVVAGAVKGGYATALSLSIMGTRARVAAAGAVVACLGGFALGAVAGRGGRNGRGRGGPAIAAGEDVLDALVRG